MRYVSCVILGSLLGACGAQPAASPATSDQLQSVSTASCPHFYRHIIGDAATPDFCISAYPMTILNEADGNQIYNENFMASASGVGSPWVNLTSEQAASQCHKLGTIMGLPSAAQADLVDAQIRANASNWSGARVNVGALNSGDEILANSTLAIYDYNDGLDSWNVEDVGGVASSRTGFRCVADYGDF